MLAPAGLDPWTAISDEVLCVLLRQEVREGVDVLCATGPVDEPEAEGLVTAVRRVLSLDPRGVVLDLSGVTTLSDDARERLGELAALPCGWPRAAFVVCPGSAVPAGASVLTADSSDEALARVETRALRPRTRMDVPHDATGPAQARAAVTEYAGRLGLDELSDDVALVVSEMVTNAVRHAAPPVSVEVEAADDHVVIAVCDGSPSPPARREADTDAEGGRGMLLVDLLTDEHGVRAQPPGKTVWARLRRGRASGS